MGKQHLEIIVTGPNHDLINELWKLIDQGNFIRSVVQDVHSKGGHEALYIAICEKRYDPEKKPFKPKPRTEKKEST